MKAKDLAELLLKYPDFEVEGIFYDDSQCTIESSWGTYHTFNINGIADIGHSSKVIVLDCD